MSAIYTIGAIEPEALALLIKERNELSRLYENTLKREYALQQECDALKTDARRYDYLLTKRLGWLSRLAPIPWKKQTAKEAMSNALDLAMKGVS